MSPSISTSLLLAQSDARLTKLAREGHERAFEALVQRYRRQLLAYCRRLLLPPERAEDALQQGLLKAWLALQGGAEINDVKPWLYRIVHNTALNMLRVSGYDYATLTETLRGADAPEEDLDRRIAVREALAGLVALPEMQREALLRTAVDGHSHERVAQALGLSEGALRGLIYRARATLRAAATAITPPPTLAWALNHRVAASVPLTSRLTELATGGGSVGVGGLLLKGGAVVVTAGALAGGIAVEHRRPTDNRSGRPLSSASTTGLAVKQQPSVQLSASREPFASARDQRAGSPSSAGERPSQRIPIIRSARPVERAFHTPNDLGLGTRDGSSPEPRAAGDGHRGPTIGGGEKGSIDSKDLAGPSEDFGSRSSGSDSGSGSSDFGSGGSGSDSGSGSSDSGSGGSDSGSGSSDSGSGSGSSGGSDSGSGSDGSVSGSGSSDSGSDGSGSGSSDSSEKSSSADGGGLIEEVPSSGGEGSQSGASVG